MNRRALQICSILALGWTTSALAQGGLVAHYEFDVDFSDSSGNELHGVPLGGASVVFDAERGSEVLSLDGDDDTVELGNSPLFDWSGAFSAAFWVNVKAWQGNYDTLLKKESAFSFERNQDHDELSFYHWPHFVPTGAALPADDGWHHVAATFDGVEQNIYLDGELVSQMEVLGDIDVNDAPVYIGSNGTTRHLNGLVDDVRLYDRVLSADEVADLAQNADIPDGGPGTFRLALDAPSRVNGVVGSTVRYDVVGTLTTEGIEGDEGANSWSVGVGAENCTIVEITTDGSVVDEIDCPNGFVHCELTSGEDNEGALCGVVLSTTELCTLPPSGTVDIFHMTVERDFPPSNSAPEGAPPCEDSPCRVFFVDGLEGSGQPVVNTVVHAEESFAPALGVAETVICPAEFLLTLDAPDSLSGAPGAVIQYDVTGNLTTSGLEGDEGASAWSVSLASDGCRVVEITTAGTIVDELGCSNGFMQCEVTSGDDNEGAVCAVVLSTTELCTLPTSGTVEILHMTVEAEVPAPVEDPEDGVDCDPALCTLSFVDGRQGSGEPVVNVVTWQSESVTPSSLAAETSICPVIVEIVRGDANADGASDLADPVVVFRFLFLPGSVLVCEKAGDADDSGTLNISDGIYLLEWLFRGGAPAAAPSPGCGLDPTEDNLGCDSFPICA